MPRAERDEYAARRVGVAASYEAPRVGERSQCVQLVLDEPETAKDVEGVRVALDALQGGAS
ncbi:MAG: hypothetical protein JWO85_2653 [Candidatus Eremiobacteraeota bacterium]|nr:hypothetical protein [Candidatus Eremiobacteraeota bacterium]